MEAVLRVKPETIVHQMTALSGPLSFKRFDDGFALTNRLRTEGLDHLLKAARAAGSRRVVAQSYGNWNYERVGGRLKVRGGSVRPGPAASDEEDPRRDPLSGARGALKLEGHRGPRAALRKSVRAGDRVLGERPLDRPRAEAPAPDHR